jgi:hypothetical protein
MKTRLKNEENTGFWQIPRASGIPLPMVVSKFFRKKRPHALLSSDFTSIFHTKFLYFVQKTQISCPFARKYFTRRNDWRPTKKF